MASKQEFLESIVPGVAIDENFYKKVYGYSLYDKPFLPIVAKRLVKTGNRQTISSYNDWLKTYKSERDAMMKEVAAWYSKEAARQYQETLRKNNINASGEEVRIWEKDIREMDDQELLTLLANLTRGA